MPEGTNIATQITRIANDRNTIRNKMIDFGLAESTANLDALATAVSGITNNGAVSAQVKEGETYTIPKGYHNGSGTVSGVAGGGNYNLQSKSITPTKSQQNVTPDEGYYGLSDVTVQAIPQAYQDVTSVTAVAGDVLANKVIVGADGSIITGTMPNNGAVAQKLDGETTSYTVPAGYHDGKGTVSVTVETKSATPTKEEQTVAPTEGSLLSSVTVGAIAAEVTRRLRESEEKEEPDLTEAEAKKIARQEIEAYFGEQARKPVADWAEAHVKAVQERGIMNGDEEGGFRPYSPVTRQELAATMVNALGIGKEPSDWAEEAFQAITQQGLLDGTMPQEMLTREQFAVVLQKLVPLLLEQLLPLLQEKLKQA